MQRPHRWLAGLAGAAAVAGGAVLAAGPAVQASSAQVFPVPASGVFVIDGHGWGHGIGMSQWGAEGGAVKGATAAQILAHYYPSTTPTAIGDPTVRVVLTNSGAEGDSPGTAYPYQCDESSSAPSVACSLTVLPATGLVAEDMATRATLTLPAGAQRWQGGTDGAGNLHLYELTSTGWHVVAIGGRATLTGPLRFFGPALVPVRYEDGSVHGYRGAVQAVHTGGRRIARVLVAPMEDYLYGVVPRESPASWAAAALQAQAVAARTYTQYDRLHAGSNPWDICDSTWCQMFEGSTLTPAGGSTLQLEYTSSDNAVNATKGDVLTYGGAPIVAMYSSSNGGWSVAGNAAYLPAESDPWDGVSSPVHDWAAQLTAAELEAAYPAVGRLTALVVTQRDGNGDWGGRVLSVTLQGVSSSGAPTSVAATGEGIYLAHPWPQYADGLLSNWWTVDPTTYPATPTVGTPVAGVWPSATTFDLFDASTWGGVQWRQWVAGSGWSTPAELAGQTTGAPAAAVSGAGQPFVFASDAVTGGLDVATWSTAWSPWRSLGGGSTARPAAAGGGTSLVYLFVRGSDGALHVDAVTPTGASGWGSLGGRLATGTGPAAVATGPGQVAVFVHGTDGMLWERRLVSGSWQPWVSLGRAIVADPAAAAQGGTVWLFVHGTDNAIWYATSTSAGGSWSGWQSLGGSISGGPSAAAKTGEVDVFGWTTGGQPVKRVFRTGWSGWLRLY